MYQIVNILNNNTSTEEENNILEQYIKKYAPYAGEDALVNFVEKMENSNVSTFAYYNRDAAVNYAKNWAMSYNTAYYPNLNNWGGDCTNFVSQCLKAGGQATDNKWFIVKKNSSYLSPSNSSQLNYSWTLADPSPWISAIQFNYHWQYKSNEKEFSAPYVYNNKSAIYSEPYTRGDVVQILRKNAWWYDAFHTMIITECDGANKEYYLTYHTNATARKSLSSIAASYNSSNYKIKFFGL